MGGGAEGRVAGSHKADAKGGAAARMEGLAAGEVGGGNGGESSADRTAPVWRTDEAASSGGAHGDGGGEWRWGVAGARGGARYASTGGRDGGGRGGSDAGRRGQGWKRAAA